MKVKESDKLRIRWSNKEQDIRFIWPCMNNGSADASYLNHFFNQEFIDEMERRGYDITTLKFSIAPKLDKPTRPERFRYLINKYT